MRDLAVGMRIAMVAVFGVFRCRVFRIGLLSI
jgi:hypothetical protein